MKDGIIIGQPKEAVNRTYPRYKDLYSSPTKLVIWAWADGHLFDSIRVRYLQVSNRFQNLDSFLFMRSVLRRELYDTLLAVD